MDASKKLRSPQLQDWFMAELAPLCPELGYDSQSKNLNKPKTSYPEYFHHKR